MAIKFIQKRGNAWRYRRRVPEERRAAIGKREITIPLGASEAEALRRYPSAHAEAERLLRQAAKPQSRPLAPTALSIHRTAHAEVEGLGLDREWSGWGTPDDEEGIAREAVAEGIAARYPLDDDGQPAGVTAEDAATLRALMLGTRDERPKATLEDAKRQYLADKVKDNEKWRKQAERIFGLVAYMVKLDTPLLSLRRADAREVRDHFLDGRTAASAQRYLNTLKAALSHAARELEVKGFENPFANLPVVDREQAALNPTRRKRDPLTEEEVKAIRQGLTGSRTDLQLIWRLVAGTGCRLAEVTGLRRVDVRLDDATPHLSIDWHEKRRIKTAPSVRLVPLLGDALEAAREAVAGAGDGDVLFPAYCREGGANRASAALAKQMRAAGIKRKEVTANHSLRHRMADLLDLAGVPERDRNLLLGHTRGKSSDGYGGEAARLEVAKRVLEAALAQAAKRP